MKIECPCGCSFDVFKKLVFAEPIEWYIDEKSNVNKICEKHETELNRQEYKRYTTKTQKDRKIYDDWVKEVLKIKENK